MIVTNVMRQKAIDKIAHSLLGIHELPLGSHSNDGPGVHMIQTATGAYKEPWCVSTCQYIFKKASGVTIADDTANAYYLADYANSHGWTVPRPIYAGFVVYHIGAGHAGTIVTPHSDGTFDAIEGNESDAVKLVHRDPRAIPCTFIFHPWLRDDPRPLPVAKASPEVASKEGSLVNKVAKEVK